jgi:hypothetical protein
MRFIVFPPALPSGACADTGTSGAGFTRNRRFDPGSGSQRESEKAGSLPPGQIDRARLNFQSRRLACVGPREWRGRLSLAPAPDAARCGAIRKRIFFCCSAAGSRASGPGRRRTVYLPRSGAFPVAVQIVSIPKDHSRPDSGLGRELSKWFCQRMRLPGILRAGHGLCCHCRL